MHGLIFFYLQKFADVAAAGVTSWDRVRPSVATGGGKYLPSGAYPDADAVATLLAGGALRMVLRNHEVAQVLSAPN